MLILNISCSQSNLDHEPGPEEVSYIIINGIRANVGVFENTNPYITKKNGVFNMNFSVGVNSINHNFTVLITENGKVFFINDYTNTVSYFQRNYYSIRFFPDNYVDVLDFSVN